MNDTMQFTVEGMSCSGCSSRLEKSLREIPGVTAATASHETGAVSVTMGDAAVPRSVIETAIEETGFDVVQA